MNFDEYLTVEWIVKALSLVNTISHCYTTESLRKCHRGYALKHRSLRHEESNWRIV